MAVNVYNHVPNLSNEIVLSIIITFYNQEEFVDKCFESIFKQKTKYSFEVVVVDDCSSDNTVKVVNYWISKFPGIIRIFKSNNTFNRDDQIARVSKCRLIGLDNARGKYLCFLDGDDYFVSSEKFEKQLNMLEANPNCCACLSAYTSTTEGAKTDTKKIPVKRVFSKKLYIENFYLPSATMIYRNTPFMCFEDNFDDNSISFALFSSRKLCYLDEITFCHFKTKNSSWLNKSSKQKIIAVLKNIFDAICFSNIKRLSLLKRHRSFIFDLYSKRKGSDFEYDDIARMSSSCFLKALTHYKESNFILKFYVKIVIFYLLINCRLTKTIRVREK